MRESLEPLARYKELIDDWPAFVEACRTPLPTVLWANPLRRRQLARLNAVVPHGPGPDARDDPGVGVPGAPDAGAQRDPDADAGAAADLLRRRLEERGHGVETVDWCPGALRVRGLEKPGLTVEYLAGLYHVMEEVSLVPGRALEPRPGERILDLCAAPGGKTVHIACLGGDRATVVGNDVRTGRLRALRANTERLGVLSVVVTRHDGTRFPLEAGPFDRILMDVPCSCEGNVRGLGQVPRGEPDGFLTGRSGLQATLLGRAWKLLAPGGTLVYATCTFAPEENEMVLDHVLGEDARIVPLDLEGLVWAPGVTEWQGARLRADCRHVARFWPHLNDTGGFTVACVRRSGDTPTGKRNGDAPPGEPGGDAPTGAPGEDAPAEGGR